MDRQRTISKLQSLYENLERCRSARFRVEKGVAPSRIVFVGSIPQLELGDNSMEVLADLLDAAISPIIEKHAAIIERMIEENIAALARSLPPQGETEEGR